MRIALAGDFDTYVVLGAERPRLLLPYRLSPGLNLLRGFQELGVRDIHIIIGTREVTRPTVEAGPFGTVHRLPCPMLSGSTSFFLWRRHLIHRELRAIQPDIVHGQGTEAEYAFSAVTSSYRNIITIHGIMSRVQRATPPPLFSLDHVPRWVEKLVIRKATDVICLSRETEKFLVEQGSPAQRHLIPNAVAPCFFDAGLRPRVPNGFSLLFVGNIYRLKGVVHLVEALATAQQELGAPIRLRLAGKTGGGAVGAQYDKLLRRRADELGVAANIEWLGALAERDVAAALTQTDVLVLPSFQETAPMAVAEAMAAGVPVLATRVGGIPDIVDEEKTGLLVAPGNSEELANAMCRLLADADLRRRLGVAGRAKALEHYAPRVVAERTLAVYQAICRR